MKHTLYYLLTGLENIAPLSEPATTGAIHATGAENGRLFSSSCFFRKKELTHEPKCLENIHCNPFGRHPAGPLPGQGLVSHHRFSPGLPGLSEADAQAVLQSIIPASERFLWTLQPIREKEGISC